MAKLKNELKITNVIIPSIEEIEKAPNDVLNADDAWWLRSPGLIDDSVALVRDGGFVDYYGFAVDFEYGMRPALEIENLESCGFEKGDKIEAFGETWTVISDKMALCDSIVMHDVQFNSGIVSNIYDESDIKIKLDQWATGKGIVLDSQEHEPKLQNLDDLMVETAGNINERNADEQQMDQTTHDDSDERI